MADTLAPSKHRGSTGGAAEEMDQDGGDVGGLSDRVYPADWATKTKAQKHNYKQSRCVLINI